MPVDVILVVLLFDVDMFILQYLMTHRIILMFKMTSYLMTLVNFFVAVLDLIGRTFVGPKKKTQAEMDVFFQGALWNLAERYTDVVSST